MLELEDYLLHLLALLAQLSDLLFVLLPHGFDVESQQSFLLRFASIQVKVRLLAQGLDLKLLLVQAFLQLQDLGLQSVSV